MGGVDTLVILGVIGGSIFCFRKVFTKFYNFINKNSGSGNSEVETGGLQYD